ncbi:hypothetical protein RQM47_12150 [Rubrivirga sp. S365]|uniref:Cbb3-type cytochrome oxidase component FixQ n=1 Tax=Rubrivirga litoralis TaxID=3075598 RepID=A0ABU3BNJ9_9BACT|nr:MULTISPECIES: hypothetical protein [unclassified Rubrivirga]MDT0630843.1 hypothetical protein [Rubrivirga sp. F394]MDT7857395.1 hypothetical protein [Rubrivirga sp. S365]
MWKETVRALQTGALAEVAVVAFVVAFLLVVVYAFTLSKRTREEIKRQPLDDAAEFYPEPPRNGTAEETDHA